MANPASNFPTPPPKFFDNGSGAKLLQPSNQVAFVANPTDLATALTASISMRDALIAAGIMKSS